MRVHSHYENLKVSRDAPATVIRAAYRALSQQYHPDRNPGDARAARVMGLVNRAYEVLSDPERRKAHDIWIQEEEASLRSQHDDTIRRHALEQAAQERRAAVPSRRRRGLAGLAALALLLVAAFVWAPGTADGPATSQAAVRAR